MSATNSNSFLVRAMAMQRKDAVLRIFALERMVLLHLCKCLLQPNSHWKTGWIKELSAWFSTIESIRLKPKLGKVPRSLLEDSNYLNTDPHVLSNILMDADMQDYLPDATQSAADFAALAAKIKPKLDVVTSSIASQILQPDKVTLQEISAHLKTLL